MSVDEPAAPKRLLQHRKVTGQEFWRDKIRDPEDVKTRQAEYVSSLPTDSNVVFYESMSGARMMDSPYALFLRLHSARDFRKLHHVWSVRSSDLIPDEFKDDPRVTFVTRGTDAHLYFLALAGYIIGNSLLPEYFVRKPDQKYLNTWHGIAYKTLGRTAASPLGAAGSVYNLLQATHVLTPCPYMTEAELTRFSLRGVFSGSMAEIGYPRQDLTLNMSELSAQRLRGNLGLDPTKKTVLYAPTWRGNKGSARFDGDQLQRDIEALAKLNANVIFQAHHIMLRHIKNVDYGNIIVPPTTMTANDLLAVADLLISDYSSIFFDFLATGKPIVHYLYDYAEYAEERGLLLDQGDLPGPIVATADELISTVTSLISEPYQPTTRYQQARERFCPHDDGQATLRTIRWFMFGDVSGIKQVDARPRPTTVFWGGRLDKTKKTQSFLDALDTAAKSGDRDVTLFVAHSVKSNPVAMERIRHLDPSVSIVARNDFEMIMTTQERQARQGADIAQMPEDRVKESSAWTRLKGAFARKTPATAPEHDLLETMYQREYRRVLGDAQFDELVEFEGLSGFWRKLAQHALK
ncbi:CDP-glycerol glycerophosphotransferase family protein [Brevibacterium sp. RIT 803]|uniref:CDP-glycerol glycerophosphotransferase family protein n=1 Tax=Brevibacterium sp. RIT 803 TaxID=2810210 RepID=UPI00195021BD|nr:CDP-glycerol glycerophosphotransferase family protein [Brevibacterium sp. RIT 803]